MERTIIARRMLAALGALTLAGCSPLADRIEANADEADGKTSGLVREVGKAAPGSVVPDTALVQHERGIWLGKSPIKLGEPPLPPVFYQSATFDRSIGSLSELAERLTLRSGIPSRVNADAQAVAAESFRRGGRALPALKGSNGSAVPPLPPGTPGAPGDGPAPKDTARATFQPDPSGGIRITYANGSFKGLLDTAAARFGVSWKYTDGVIQFFHTEARTFQINAVPGDSTFTASVVSGASSSSGGSGGQGGSASGGGAGGSGNGGTISANNSQNTGVASKLSVYTGIESAIKVMLSPHGKVLASPATGAITVVDTPDSLQRIAAYVDSENKALSRQIAINVTVLSVSLNRGDEYGIDWNLVYKGLKRTYGIQNVFPASATNPVGFSAGIVGNSKWAGSDVLVKALSQQGKVRRQTTASVVTLNNQPVPVQVARQTSYLASAQTSIVAQVGSQSSLVPGTVSAGFNMSILPHVLTNGTVMLQFSIDISTLRGLRTIEGANNTRIETPELDTRNFLQRVSMKSSETLVISGFEQTDENIDNRGVGSPKNALLGGGVRANSNKEVIVILITPVTMAGA
ncbi:type IVB pilus formation R64 PilN family outer membrane protein [Pseudoduganella flava]|uniref:Type IVB pilus formation R64 PilN family outer membrane protein n=2 Tax=Pseudoduganella flava TaxID=871742 RepID=A0A562PEP8_9BURK|nr:type IVB pilus formation R64 PilN family outer membrane protein [Pseudoduganella flava]